MVKRILKDGQSLVCKRKTELGLQKENWIRSVKQGTGWICKSEDWIGSDKVDWIPSLKYEMDLQHMDWILFEKRGMDCVCKATNGHVNVFFFSEGAIFRAPSRAYETMFKNPTQFMFSAGSVVLRFAAPLSCVALDLKA